MSDWDDDEWEPEINLPGKNGAPVASQWDDEDAEEEEDKPKVKTAAKPKKTKKDKAVAEPSPAEEELDPLERKLREQRLVEEGDLKVALDTFGDSSDKKFNIDEMLPKSLADFEYFGTQVGLKLKRHEDGIHYKAMIKSLLTTSISDMNSNDIKELGTLVSRLQNERMKSERVAAGVAPKKKKAQKKSLKMEKDDLFDGSTGGAMADDDYDFM